MLNVVMLLRFSLYLLIITTVSCIPGNPTQPTPNPIVTTSQGTVMGTLLTSTSGRPIYTFFSMPYAKPPIGDLRFRAPVEYGLWTGVRNANVEGPICLQIFTGPIGVSEDCLTLNVFTPQLPNATNGLLPVLFWIHGGGFYIGSAFSQYTGPQKILNKDVILVTTQYRLGALGFLSTQDSAASGNFGLLDQTMALKWVQDNIVFFGGDKTRVTIFGESAGAISVSYHILSKVSKGLFQAAIGDSGNTFLPCNYQKYPLDWAHKLGDQFYCPSTDTQLLVNCLREQDALAIVNTSANVINAYNILDVGFLPVIENPVSGIFITETPETLLQKGDFTRVPYLTGVNKDEGVITYYASPATYDQIDATFFNVKLPAILKNITHFERNLDKVALAVKVEYYDKIDVTNNTQVVQTSIDLNSDSFFKAPNDMNVRLLTAAGVPVFMYVFTYAGCFSYGETLVVHGVELRYLFFSIYDIFVQQTANDTAITNLMVDLWTNFATHLNPTPPGYSVQWLQTSSSSSTDQIRYLHIDNPQDVTMSTNYLQSRMYFWNIQMPPIVNGP